MEESQGRHRQELTSLWNSDGEFRVIWKVSIYGSVAFSSMIVSYIGITQLFPWLPWRFGNPLAVLIAAVTATIFCARLLDRRSVSEMMGLQWQRRAGALLLYGLGLTLLLLLLLLLLELLFADTRIFLSSVTLAHTLSLLFLGLLSFTLVGFAEEILVRGYPFLVLREQTNTVTALLLTSGVFSLIHALNPGIGWIGFLNIFLAGIWLGIARVRSGSLWLPVGLHIGWNFFMGPVFGFPVSGIIERSMFITQSEGPAWIVGGVFGPEGGLLVTMVLLAGIIILYHPRLRASHLHDEDAASKKT